MFGIGLALLQPKGNIIAPIVFIPAKNAPKIRGSFAIKPSDTSMLKAICGLGGHSNQYVVPNSIPFFASATLQ